MNGFVTHPMLRSAVVESRAYQLLALNTILDSSSLLVLPTGMGKTPVELMAIADRLHSRRGRAILVAPTNPLVEQHYHDAFKFLDLEQETELVRVNGSIPWQKREQKMRDARLIVATPQVIRNDVQRGVLSLADVSLLVLDEGHHASGNHAMAQLADLYNQQSVDGLLLAATASPGSNEQVIGELIRRLGVQRIVSMRRDDALLAPHAVNLESIVVELEVGDELRELAAPFEAWLERLVETLRRSGVYVQQGMITSKGLNDARGRAGRLIATERKDGWRMAKIVADCSRVLTLINLLLCQGVDAARSYILRNTKARENEPKLARFIDSTQIAILRSRLEDSPEMHIKVPRTKQLVAEQLGLDPQSRVIVFATLRDSVHSLTRALNEVPGVIAESFIGQSSRGDEGGMSQKAQIASLDRFRAGECNVLIATSVGEEGLDVPSADRVIFYEPVASEIRTIQRRGRTGRHKEGFVFTLVAKGTRDEGVRHASRAREVRMQRVLNRVKSQRDLTALLSPPIDRLEAFEVTLDGAVLKASEFAAEEKVRLESSAAKKRQHEQADPLPASTPFEPAPPAISAPAIDMSIAERLRPSGQSGLEAFMEKEIEASIEAAENIVQGFSTPILDARDSRLRGCIVADHREMSSDVVARLRVLGMQVDIETLPLGDYRVGDRVIVERKTVRDLIDSIVDGRLFNQARRLAAAAPRPIIILEGEGVFRQGRLHPEVIYGSISSLALDHGLVVLTTENGAQTARLLTALLRREEEMLEMISTALVDATATPPSPRSESEAIDPTRNQEGDLSIWEEQLDTDQQQIAVRMLEGIDGVGTQLARRLVQHLGGLHRVLEADDAALLAVEGVGPMLAQRIQNLFNPR